jgi:hypothetical protein
MAKLGIEPLRSAPCDGPELSYWYSIPKKWVKIRLPVKRAFNEEQKKAIADATRLRFKLAKEAKRNGSSLLSPEMGMLNAKIQTPVKGEYGGI